MKKALIIVDMQVDFVSGALGSREAVKAAERIAEKLKNAPDSEILFTMDTHDQTYLSTLEGRNLPVEHCVEGTPGWEITPELRPFYDPEKSFRKDTFGSTALAQYLKHSGPYDQIELAGVCTDICVISNALLIKAFLPQTPVLVDASCCAGVTPESHETALAAMRQCQITILT